MPEAQGNFDMNMCFLFQIFHFCVCGDVGVWGLEVVGVPGAFVALGIVRLYWLSVFAFVWIRYLCCNFLGHLGSLARGGNLLKKRCASANVT